MSIDDIKKWLAGNKAGFNNQGKVLDALRTAVEELDDLRLWLCEKGEYRKAMATRNQLESIREELGIKETHDG